MLRGRLVDALPVGQAPRIPLERRPARTVCLLLDPALHVTYDRRQAAREQLNARHVRCQLLPEPVGQRLVGRVGLHRFDLQSIDKRIRSNRPVGTYRHERGRLAYVGAVSTFSFGGRADPQGALPAHLYIRETILQTRQEGEAPKPPPIGLVIIELYIRNYTYINVPTCKRTQYYDSRAHNWQGDEKVMNF